MSDWKKRNEDWRDEDELEEEEECECPWVDSKGKVRETAYCQYLLEKHPMMCLKQKMFDQNGEVDEDALLYEVHSDLRDFVLDNLARRKSRFWTHSASKPIPLNGNPSLTASISRTEPTFWMSGALCRKRNSA